MSKWLSAPVPLPVTTFGPCSGCGPDFTAIGPSFEQNRAMLAGKADFLLLALRRICESNRHT
jgi:hypothetical protein